MEMEFLELIIKDFGFYALCLVGMAIYIWKLGINNDAKITDITNRHNETVREITAEHKETINKMMDKHDIQLDKFNESIKNMTITIEKVFMKFYENEKE